MKRRVDPLLFILIAFPILVFLTIAASKVERLVFREEQPQDFLVGAKIQKEKVFWFAASTHENDE